MSQKKKEIRTNFRDKTFARDGHKCRVCSDTSKPLDAHHVTDRNLMPNGGYVPENGISLCPECHVKAEVFHSTGTPMPGFSPEELYNLIQSSYDLAVKASNKL
jgi:5-methylcytosine-specific restriction endonuclease McrA